MNRSIALSVAAGLAALGLASAPGRADSQQLSPERLDMLDRLGYFTPGFKAAVHKLVDSKQALEQARAEQTKLEQDLPDLQKQATETEAKTVALRQELAKYDHPEENDFVALQKQMNDPGATLEEQIAEAQAYVWTYPTSPHESEAQQYLQQAQKKQADLRQAEKDAEAAREDAHAKLVQRAQAHDLSLSEWRDFLRDMSQDDLVKLLGPPTSTSEAGNYWIYSGGWILDPTTHQRVGMEINFNGGRVIGLDEKPPPP
jgi:chromosome segregation ATPase